MTSQLIDRLENRTLFASGPVVTSTLFVGDHDAITAVVIGFDRALEPTAAQDLANYKLWGVRNGGRVDSLPYAAATYNATDHTVTLTRSDSFRIRFFRSMRVVAFAEKAGNVVDDTGNLLDGDRDGTAGGDFRVVYKVHRGRGHSYRDTDGDRVTLKARGPEGRRRVFCLSYKKELIQVWLDGTDNTLTGTVKATKNSNGVVTIPRVVLVDSGSTNALESPFVVGQTVLDGQSPIDPLLRTF